MVLKAPHLAASSRHEALAGTPQTATLRSGLLPLIRTRLQETPGSRVLDFGLPTTNKLTYLSQPQTRVFWNNLPEGLGDGMRRGFDDEPLTDGELKEFFVTDEQPSFDVILFWDYFDYMTFESVRVLMRQLARHCQHDTWIYFLVSQAADMPPVPADIDLTLDDCLRYTALPATRTAPRYAPKVMEEGMPGFHILKLYLLKNGVQEHLFHYKAMPPR